MKTKNQDAKRLHSVLLQAHAHIISYLKQEMPTIFCKESKKHNLIYQLPVIFTKIQQQQQVPAGDFPDCTRMQVGLMLKTAYVINSIHF